MLMSNVDLKSQKHSMKHANSFFTVSDRISTTKPAQNTRVIGSKDLRLDHLNSCIDDEECQLTDLN